MTYFHGSTRELEKFDPGTVHLATSFEDARGFVEWGAEPGDELFVHEVEARPGEMVRQGDIVPGSGWGRERATGARYVSFTHDDGMEVVVSLYPDEDLRITRKEKLTHDHNTSRHDRLE